MVVAFSKKDIELHDCCFLYADNFFIDTINWNRLLTSLGACFFLPLCLIGIATMSDGRQLTLPLVLVMYEIISLIRTYF